MPRLGILALQLLLCCCVLTPGKMPGAAAMCAPPPRHAWRHWRCSRHCATESQLLEKPRRCSHVCAAATSHPGTSGCCILMPLQPCVRHRHITPGDIGSVATAAPLRLDAWQKRPALQPCACRHHVTPGDISAAAAAAPLHLDARQNAFTLGKMPGETPGIAVIFQNTNKSKT
jgi:hypothetical protein